MKQIIILGLAIILVFSSFKEKEGVKLSIDIQNFDPDLLQIVDAFGFTTWSDHLKKEGDKFVISLPIDKPCMWSVSYNFKNYKRIFLYPGQTLEISFDPKNFESTFHYGGSLAKENAILDAVVSQINKIDRNHFKKHSLDNALSYIDSAFNANNQYFEKLISGKQPTPVFIEFAKASILYHSLNSKMYILGNQKDVKDSMYDSFLNQKNIENDKYLNVLYYRWFLGSYISMQTKKRYDKLDSLKKLAIDAEFDEGLKVIGNFKNKNVREFLLANDINSRLKQSGFRNFDKYNDYFKKNNSNPDYTALIRKTYETKQLLAPGKPAPKFSLLDVDGNRVSLSDFKGKYVFIDFWQTLCTLSARELPYYLKLYADYKAENIVFVSISANEDKEVWRNYVKEKKNVGISLIAEKHFSGEAFKSYQVSGTPFFVILDMEGNIIDPSAAKPSSKEIRETLDRILKSK